jgi:hypothetical protein
MTLYFVHLHLGVAFVHVADVQAGKLDELLPVPRRQLRGAPPA